MRVLQKGFTLIEMLVVIAIISILIGIGVNTFTIAQKKARDVRRKADLRSIQVALELYKQDKGSYPTGGCTNYYCYTSSTTSNYISGLEPDYIPKLPTDPKTPNTGPAYSAGKYSYTYGNSVTSPGTTIVAGYDLLTRLENAEDPDACGKQASPYTYSNGTIFWCGGPYPPQGVSAGEYLYVLHGN